MLEEKRSIHETLKRKIGNIRSLIERNRISKGKKCIGFPFLVVEPAGIDGTRLDLQMQKDCHKLSVASNHEVTIHGVLGVVSMIGGLRDANLF